MSRAEREHWASKYGTDAAFRDWITYQPSCIDSTFGEWHDGVGRNVACHVRTVAAGAGPGIKPPFSCVPITDAQHKLTHQHGNSFYAPADWWQKQAEEYLERWVEAMRGR